jgi:UDP-glucose:(heptosyl)LPS alpha-1,3-glucosyltransferase
MAEDGVVVTRPDARPVVAIVARDVHERGGMERVHAELIRRLAGRYRFIVISTTLDPDLRQVATWLRVRTPRRPASIAAPAFFAGGSIRPALARADIVHTCGAVVANHVDLSTVHFCHAAFRSANGGLSPKEAPVNRRLNTAVLRSFAIATERWCYRPGRTGALGAVSGQVEDEIGLHYPRTRVVSTPNGVDIDRFRPDAQARVVVRNDRHVGPDEVVALFVGGDWDRKGLALAIEGIAEARRLGASMRLWVLGSGAKDRFYRYAVEQGVASDVDFLGQRDDPALWYQGADVFLCCSRYETFSLATVEAAASGLPVVTTPVGVACDIVFGADNARELGGVIIKSDPIEIGRVLAELAMDEARRQQLGTTAQHRAVGFGWDQLAERVDDVYQDLLSRADRSKPATVRRYWWLKWPGGHR